MAPPRFPAVLLAAAAGVDFPSKFSIESCARDSEAGSRLSCDRKIVLDTSVPSDSALMVAKITEAEGNDTNASGVYAAFALTYLWVKFNSCCSNLVHF